MGILDIFKTPKNEIMTTHGVTGTELQSGVITEDYNSDLQFPESIRIYDEMRKSDGTTIAILRAIKQPLVSAKWQIQSGGEDARDKEIADFVTHNLFEKIKFKHFLRESLGFLDFGFYYFEKNFEVVDGKIEWKELSPRVPKSHYIWGLQKQKEWVDGHPVGVTQQIVTTDEAKDGNLYREIPWSKIILFSFEREGNNYEGTSILRNAYKHFYYKDLLYKVQSISAERYGVGIPVASVKSSMNSQNKDKLVELLKNIRSNEQSYGVHTDDAVVSILTPSARPIPIEAIVDHHDRKIYDSILAGFLNLTSGDGGSNALSKDQSSFFLRGLQGVADFFIDTMNEHIKELVDLNYNDVKIYPTLLVSEIGSISMDENINSINTAIAGGMLELTDTDKDAIRNILKLPELPPLDDADIEMNNLEAEMAMEELEIGTLEDFEGEMGQGTADEPNIAQELSEFMEFADDRADMTDETKKKISEALMKGGQKSGGFKNVSMQSQGDFINSDPKISQFQTDKKRVTGMMDALKSSMESMKAKRTTMSKDQKKKFAGEFKKKVGEMQAERVRLQSEGRKLRSEEGTRKDTLKKAHREGKKQLQQAKATERTNEQADKLKVRTEKKTAKDAERAVAKTKRESERAKKKADSETAKALKKNKKLAEGVEPKPREVMFTEKISEFEKYLQEQYERAEDIVIAAEHEYQDALEELYDSSTTARSDGVVCLVYDKTKITAGKNKVQKITDRLEKQLIGSAIQDEIFQKALDMAEETLLSNDKLLASNGQWHKGKRIEVTGAGNINSFIDGYVSNMQGVLYNESRRVLENITLNYGAEASLDLAKKTATEITINKNILSLSFITHPRALYKFVIYNEAQAEGFTMFKTLVPTDKIPNVIDRPFGMTASLIFTISTAAQINKAASVAAAGKTAEAIAGLGLHHGSFEYYYPIQSTDLIEEEAIAKAQRDELQSQMDIPKE